MPLYSEIRIDNLMGIESQYRFAGEPGAACDSLSGLGRINLFVGKNNSGKSRLLRALFAAKDYECVLAGHPTGSEIKAILEPLQGELRARLAGPVTGYLDVTAQYLDDVIPLRRHISGAQANALLTKIRDKVSYLARPRERISQWASQGHVRNDQIVMQIYAAIRSLAERTLRELPRGPFPECTEPRVHLPLLRGLRPIANGDHSSLSC